MVAGVFALPAVLAPDVGYTRKTVDQKRPAPDSLIYAVTTTLPMGFFMGDVFLSRITARSREVLIILFSFAATTLLHRCLVAKLGLGSAGFRWSYADIFGCTGSRRELH